MKQQLHHAKILLVLDSCCAMMSMLVPAWLPYAFSEKGVPVSHLVCQS